MVGTDINLKFETLLDENYSGYWDTADKNIFFATALNTVTNDLIKVFQSNNNDLTRLMPLLQKSTPIVSPASNVIDISKASSQIVGLKQVLIVDPTFNSTQKTIRTTPITYADFGAIYSNGTVRYPKYILSANGIDIYPKTPAITTCTVWYISEPIYIDVANSSTVIPYTDEMVELIIKAAIVEATKSTREFSMTGIEQQALIKEL
jgi:hypothetical protein